MGNMNNLNKDANIVDHIDFIHSIDLTNLDRHLIEDKKTLEGKFFSYFLINKDVVVYIGVSNNVGRRVIEHLAQGLKEFDSYCFIEIPSIYDPKQIEHILIDAYSPIYNRDNRFIAKRKKLAKILNISLEDAMEYKIKIEK